VECPPKTVWATWDGEGGRVKKYAAGGAIKPAPTKDNGTPQPKNKQRCVRFVMSNALLNWKMTLIIKQAV